MTTEKEQFIEQQYQQQIDMIVNNLDFCDSLVYSEPTFVNWLTDNGIGFTDIQTILDWFDVNDYIKTEHAGGFYSVSKDQFIVFRVEEFEDQLGDWYTKDEQDWINEEFTVQGDLFYIYNPTSFYITIDDIKAFLKDQ